MALLTSFDPASGSDAASSDAMRSDASTRLYGCDLAEMWVLADKDAVAQRMPAHLGPTLTAYDPITQEPLGHLAQVQTGTCQAGASGDEQIEAFGFVRSMIFVGPVAGPRTFNDSLLLEWQVDSAPLAAGLSPWTEHMVVGEFSLYDALSGRPVAFTVDGEPWSLVTMGDVVPADPSRSVTPSGTLHMTADGAATACATKTAMQPAYATSALRLLEIMADDAGAILGHQGFWQQSGPAPAVHVFSQTLHWDAVEIRCDTN